MWNIRSTWETFLGWVAMATELVYIHDFYLLTILESPIIHSVYPEICLYLIAF